MSDRLLSVAAKLVCAFALTAFSPQGLGLEIRFNPVAADGNVVCLPDEGDCGPAEIRLSEGGVAVTLFIEVSGWDADGDGSPTLGAFQGTVNPTTYQGGLTPGVADADHPGNPGTLVGADLVPLGYPDEPERGAFQALRICTLDQSEPVANADWLSRCVTSEDCPPSPAACIDRPDYVFYQLQNFPIVATDSMDYLWAASSWDCAVDPDGGLTRFYGGTLVLEVPIGAVGTYNVGFVQSKNFTLFNDCTSVFLPGLSTRPAQITVGTSRCCAGIGTDNPQCFTSLTEAECASMPEPNAFELGITCGIPCPECVQDADCDDPTPAQSPGADNLCTNDFCDMGHCYHLPNFNEALFCCNPDQGPPNGLAVISDGDECTTDVCDRDTGVVTHDGGDCDGDTVCDDVDNCPTVSNFDQYDADEDGFGDACDGPFDGDHDGDVALEDAASFLDCLTGPGASASDECQDTHDVNLDTSVDLRDVARLQSSFTGHIPSLCP